MKAFINHPCQHEAAVGHRRILVAAAFAALIAEAGFAVSGADQPGAAPADTGATSQPRSASISLVATESPEPTADTLAPETPLSSAAAPPRVVPPPAPPSELRLWYGDPSPDGIPAFVAITNNADKPPVGCVYRAVAVAGPATKINYNDSVNFTVTGAAETRIDRHGPATGTTWHVTITCDNGLTTSQDHIY
ncbi:hypothetical protein A5791_07705 [Mycobacterium sp. 852002-51163_SCH5372311]|uniref:hypothetical protein n=1 Tax=Mycobacterium sp. 852002-51163_SCH5372311 TaxID=1834097 RepID=UPI0007FDF13D|nr:hypothetical protein [Mycobacterium sp. 852002-51163_SCH5372311]OBF80709.1 hypothetical protein A5791_07705 [Mycobacterium sp. 852002-51163_SCH5372311]